MLPLLTLYGVLALYGHHYFRLTVWDPVEDVELEGENFSSLLVY